MEIIFRNITVVILVILNDVSTPLTCTCIIIVITN